jgi:hypothetical protein
MGRQNIIFSLCHTTARLPDGWRKAAQAWFDNCDHPEQVEHVLVTDEPLQIEGIFPITIAGLNQGPHTCVAGWNHAYQLSSGKFIISLADDWFPCEHWDTELLKVLPDLAGEFVVNVDTLGNDHLMCFVMATHAYLEQYNHGEGWMFYPEYDGMYADNDFTDSAALAQVIINAKHLKFPHYHPAFFPAVEADAIHLKQGRPEAYKLGFKVYKERCKAKGLSIRPKLAVCLPGETFSSVWMAHWTTLCNALSQQFDLSPLFGFSSNVHVTRACFADQCLRSIPRPDYVLWLDDDNTLTVAQFNLLFEDLARMPEADMVVGWCWIAADVYNGSKAITSVGHLDEKGRLKQLPYTEMMQAPYDVQEISHSGFPCVLMRGEMLEKAGYNPFLPVISPTHAYGFASEDVSFCIHAKERGCRLFVDRRVKVPHYKLRDAEPQQIPVHEMMRQAGEQWAKEEKAVAAFRQAAERGDK